MITFSIKDDKESNSAYIHWACTAPHNNVWEYGEQQYQGVGGHLLAIVAQKSVERYILMSGRVMNCNTYKNRKMVEQYLNEFNPYENHQSIKIDLVELTRYAKSVGKQLNELNEEEIAPFRR